MKRRHHILLSSIASDTSAIEGYCKGLGIDGMRLLQSMGASGGSSPATYIEEPNETLIRTFAEFLAVPSPTIFVVMGAHGMGKTAAKDFVVRVLALDSRFVCVCIDTPGPYTPTQFQRLIYDLVQRHHHENAKGGASRGLVYQPKSKETRDLAIRTSLTRLREAGTTTILWVDEAQTLTVEKLEMLRRLADITTDEGAPACKVVVAGTPQLQTKMESWRSAESHEDAIGAIDDRIGLYTLTLSPWTPEDIMTWWQKSVDAATLSHQTQCRNPFDPALATVIHQYSDGQPRSVAQLSVLALTTTARRVTATPPSSPGDALVTPTDLAAALAPRIQPAPTDTTPTNRTTKKHQR